MPEEYSRTLTDGPWSVRWMVRADFGVPIGIAIEDEAGAAAIPLTRARAELLRQALDEALRHAP